MATITIGNFNSEKVVTGLNTYQYTVSNTSMHVVKCKLIVPVSSSVSLVITQNGTTRLSASVISHDAYDAQSQFPFQVTMNCTSGDVIQFQITSAAAADNQLNVVKAILNIHQGSGN